MSEVMIENPHQIIYFEDVLPKTGWGLYYKFMVGMACVCSFTQATALLCISFSIPLSTCDQYITRDILYGMYFSLILGSWLYIIIFPLLLFGLIFKISLGRASAGGILSCLYDIYGRKQLISYSLLMIFITTLTAAFSYNYYIIMFAAFFLGAGLECNTSVVKVHLAEILPKKKRGVYLCFCNIFWYIGYIAISLFAVLMRNPSVDHRVVDMRVTTWRMIFAISGGFNVIIACASALLEESPRYFLQLKKNYLALLMLKQFYAINKSSYGESFPECHFLGGSQKCKSNIQGDSRPAHK